MLPLTKMRVSAQAVVLATLEGKVAEAEERAGTAADGPEIRRLRRPLLAVLYSKETQTT